MVLTADRTLIAAFCEALFMHADGGTFASLRAFDQFDSTKTAVLIEPVRINGSLDPLVKAAGDAVDWIANLADPAVFAPPVCTFSNPNRGRTQDLANGLVLSVEIDDGDTRAKQLRLESLLGFATLVVASGSTWNDPDTGEVFPKVHLHWRLDEPTRTDEEHQKLRRARNLAALLTGADPTGKPTVHPLRWPGSWNIKSRPVLATIIQNNTDSEISLDDALERLEMAVEAEGMQDTGLAASGTPEAPLDLVAGAMAAIPNPGVLVHYDEWIKYGYATYRATGGLGYDVWDAWSKQSDKYDATEQDAAWTRIGKAISGSAASVTIGAGTIFFAAKKHGWQRPEPEPPPPIDDPGYYDAIDAMSAAEWEELKARETGQPIHPSPEAMRAAGSNLLWTIEEPWIEAEIPVRPWIARGFLMRRAVTVLSGPGSAGKSSLMVAWATAISIGSPFSRFKIRERLKVATYNVEDDSEEQRRRFSAFYKKIGVDPASTFPNLAILGPSGVGTLLNTARDGSLLVNTPVMEKLEQFIKDFAPDVLILDPFVELHQAEENDNTAVRAVMARLRSMAIERNMSVVILHHARKGAGTPGDPDSLRGASSIVGAARVALTLNVMTEQEADKSGITLADRHNYFRLDHAKSNYAPIAEAEWFRREEVTLENGSGDDEPDGVAVVWPWKPAQLWAGTSTPDLNTVLDEIGAGTVMGILYTATRRNGGEHWAGHVLIRRLGVSEAQAARMVQDWIRNGVLWEDEYRHPEYRRMVKGLKVNESKRPGSRPSGH